MQNDPFEALRNAINVVRGRLGDPDYLPCAEALWLHTMGAATVLGLDHEIGSLEPGKKADLIVVDLNGPHLQTVLRRLPALVFTPAPPTWRSASWTVGGAGGRPPTRLDVDAAMAGLARHCPHWARTLRGLGSRCVCCG